MSRDSKTEAMKPQLDEILRSKLNLVCNAWVGTDESDRTDESDKNRDGVRWVVRREARPEHKQVLDQVLDILNEHIRSTLASPADLYEEVESLKDKGKKAWLMRLVRQALLSAITSHVNSKELRGQAEPTELDARDLAWRAAQRQFSGR